VPTGHGRGQPPFVPDATHRALIAFPGVLPVPPVEVAGVSSCGHAGLGRSTDAV